ncbi:hypothetical protein AGLY_002791 [Aphis glycines]|uniref:Uncharacterized protein n=1 Tax=Aphis glycines TaxID=307491 RepID=A0A6G0U269_APHGL|nr:hypothetical protein AGLY_002791 [Aphis glycines]
MLPAQTNITLEHNTNSVNFNDDGIAVGEGASRELLANSWNKGEQLCCVEFSCRVLSGIDSLAVMFLYHLKIDFVGEHISASASISSNSSSKFSDLNKLVSIKGFGKSSISEFSTICECLNDVLEIGLGVQSQFRNPFLFTFLTSLAVKFSTVYVYDDGGCHLYYNSSKKKKTNRSDPTLPWLMFTVYTLLRLEMSLSQSLVEKNPCQSIITYGSMTSGSPVSFALVKTSCHSLNVSPFSQLPVTPSI